MRDHRTGGKTKQEAIFPFKRRLSRPGVPSRPSKRKGPATLFLLLDGTRALLKTPNNIDRTSKGNSSGPLLTRSSEQSSFPMSLRTLHPHPEMLRSWTSKARGMLPQRAACPGIFLIFTGLIFTREIPHISWNTTQPCGPHKEDPATTSDLTRKHAFLQLEALAGSSIFPSRSSSEGQWDPSDTRYTSQTKIMP